MIQAGDIELGATGVTFLFTICSQLEVGGATTRCMARGT